MIQTFKTLQNYLFGGCIDILSTSLKIQLCSFPLQGHLHSHRNHLRSVFARAPKGKPTCQRFAGQRTQKVLIKHVCRRPEHACIHTRAQVSVCVCTHAHGGRRGSVFSNEVCKQVQINQVWPYFHLETIFSNISHIPKNRFRCLELVQNGCKKCSVQMKKISLQCLLLSAFLTE